MDDQTQPRIHAVIRHVPSRSVLTPLYLRGLSYSLLCWKQVVPNHARSQVLQAKITMAKKAALDASKKAFHPPTHLPGYDTEKGVKAVKAVKTVKA